MAPGSGPRFASRIQASGADRPCRRTAPEKGFGSGTGEGDPQTGGSLSMRYPIAIEPGDEKTAFVVVVPHLPGCFSAGAPMDEALAGAEEAAAARLDAPLHAGRTIPEPSELAGPPR